MQKNSSAPLDGIKILDLTRLLPGPLATMYLADLGAEVVKIEDPEIGDYARHIPPIKNKNSYSFLVINRNKKSVVLDLRKNEDREHFYGLVREFDVVVESFRPGVCEKLAIDFETVRKFNPAIVYCSLTGYGHTGPLKEKAGHDLNFLSLSGLLDQMGPAKKPPCLINFQIADIAGGSLTACIAILAALLKAQRTKAGSFVDVALLDGTLALSPLLLGALAAGGGVPERGRDLLSGGSPFYNVYETKDGRFMALGAIEKKFWENFCKAVRRTDLSDKHTLELSAHRSLFKELKDIFASKTQKSWIRLLENVDACCTPVLRLDEALKHPQVLARSLEIECVHPTEGVIRQFALPIKWSDWEFSVRTPPPLLGANQEEY
jgi:alpha-methylacyl-CoA racemase